MGEGVPKDMDAAYEWFAAARDNGHAYAEFFMKRMERGEQEPPSVLLSATRLLYHMGNIFRDNAPAPAANGVQIDHKRLQRLREKKMAMGHISSALCARTSDQNCCMFIVNAHP